MTNHRFVVYLVIVVNVGDDAEDDIDGQRDPCTDIAVDGQSPSYQVERPVHGSPFVPPCRSAPFGGPQSRIRPIQTVESETDGEKDETVIP